MLTRRVCVVCDAGRAVAGAEGDVAAAGSPIKLLVIPTDEELAIAEQTMQASLLPCRKSAS